MNLRCAAVLILTITTAGCVQHAAGPVALTGDSKTLRVRGQYAPIALDRIDRMSLADGRLVLHGGSSLTVDLPPSADAASLVRHWALTTETNAGRTRSATFTHAEKLDDFTIELPASDAPLRHGGFAGANGEEVLVFAWGAESQSYWGHVTIAPAESTRGQ